MSRIAESIIVGAAYLAASMLVFVFTSSYFSLFRTNRSRVFRAALPVVAIPITWLLVQFSDDPSWGRLAIGFTAASLANLTGWSAARLHRPLRIRDDSLRGIALAKGLEAMAVVGSILAVLVLAGIPLGSVYLRLGKIGLGLGIGLGGLVLFAALAALQARSMRLPPSLLFRLLPWDIAVYLFQRLHGGVVVSGALPPPSYLPPRADRSDRPDRCGVRAGAYRSDVPVESGAGPLPDDPFPTGDCMGCVHTPDRKRDRLDPVSCGG